MAGFSYDGECHSHVPSLACFIVRVRYNCHSHVPNLLVGSVRVRYNCHSHVPNLLVSSVPVRYSFQSKIISPHIEILGFYTRGVQGQSPGLLL